MLKNDNEDELERSDEVTYLAKEVLDRLSVELVREDDAPHRSSCLRDRERRYMASLDPWLSWRMTALRCRRSFVRENIYEK